MTNTNEIKWYVKFYLKVKWHLNELNKTLSSEHSYYSSKRIERLILFISANAIVDYYVWEHHETMSTNDVLLVFGAKMVYAGFQVKQINKEIKKDETTA